jgi:hypothetical protein
MVIESLYQENEEFGSRDQAGGKWLNHRDIKWRANFNTARDWNNSYDGVFFIRDMYPCKAQ